MAIKKRTLIQQVKAARVAAVPFVNIASYDPLALIRNIHKALSEDSDQVAEAFIMWDSIQGPQSLFVGEEGEVDPGQTALVAAGLDGVANCEDFLRGLERLPDDMVVFAVNLHLQLEGAEGPRILQALANLRDHLKAAGSTLFMLGPPYKFPVEVINDVVVFDEALPTDEELESIVRYTVTAAEVKVTDDQVQEAVNALRGVPSFPAEQATAMSIKKSGLDNDGLWERKLQLITQTEGLTAWMGGQRLDSLRGLEGLKAKTRRIIRGRKPFKVVVWIDEGEKDMAGQAGDTSGTSQDQLKVLLTEMEDREYDGMIFVGVPGSAKSAFAKALGNEANVLTIRMDLGGLKAKHVGESERRIREAMKVIEAVGGPGGAFFVMTSNNIDIVRPELKRRFKKGIYFFDLPTAEERDSIWELYLSLYPDIEDDRDRFSDEGWTGAEIRNCVEAAYNEMIPLSEAALDIVPVAISGREAIEKLRADADGRFKSTSVAGVYRRPAQVVTTPKAATGRKVRPQAE